jgi:hypothetical protein
MHAHGIARGAGIGKPDRFGAAAAARRSHNLLICPPSPAASSAEQVALIAPLRPACEPVLTCRSPAARGSVRFRHFVTAITGGGWVLCEVKTLSHGMEGKSNAYHRFGYCRRDRIRRLVGLYGCAVEGWEGGCACGVGSDLIACDCG